MFSLKDLDSVAINLSKLKNVCWTEFLIPKHQLDYKFIIDLLLSKNATLPKAGGKRRGYRIREHKKMGTSKQEHQKIAEKWRTMTKNGKIKFNIKSSPLL